MTETETETEQEVGTGLAIRGEMSDTALVLDDPDRMSFEEYEGYCSTLGRLARASMWWIGDMILYGEASFGETSYQAHEKFGLAKETLIHAASICRAVPPSRRRAELSFAHHAAVRALPANDQKRLLAQASKNKWTMAEMRENVRDERGEDPTRPPSPGQQLLVAAEDLWAAAERDENDSRAPYTVPAEAMDRLVLALARFASS